MLCGGVGVCGVGWSVVTVMVVVVVVVCRRCSYSGCWDAVLWGGVSGRVRDMAVAIGSVAVLSCPWEFVKT